MKLTWAAAVVLGLGLAAMAGAQNAPNTPRAMGMGSAVIGVADDAGAWAQNPAGLGALHVRTQDGKAFGNDVVIALGKVRPGNDTALGINWSGWNPLTTVGFGAGLNRMGDTKTFGAGVGMGYRADLGC